MNADETIALDAEILCALDTKAWKASLPNGHRIVAFIPGGRDVVGDNAIGPGARVRVRMSPFDMGRGEITAVPNPLEQREREG
jgi:translation initiation factor IF-1